jgi:hypothetical protein
MAHASYEAQLWNDREYEAGRNGEASPIRLQDHGDSTNIIGAARPQAGRHDIGAW